MITIVKPGLLTTIQDEGRWGYQAYGMPVSGAMDRYAYRTANILAGNAAGAAAFEMTMLGATYRFETEALIAICGADMQATLNGEPVSNWSALSVQAGSELSFQFAAQGCRAYLAVQGGVDVPPVLGSRATYTRGQVGGKDGRALKAGDVIARGQASAHAFCQPKCLPAEWIPALGDQIAIRVLAGPQGDYFTEGGMETFFSSQYVISDEADRMGYRMDGAKIEHSKKPDIVSDALCLGAIQVPGHGMPIVMMADRQTTGGYAKIGTVIGPDLWKLAQAKPGDTVRFIRCTDEEAVEALRAENSRYEQLAAWAAAGSQPSGGGKRYQMKINGVSYKITVEAIN